MKKALYVVVKDGLEKKFTKWHGTYKEAHDEAERRCRLERKPFFVLRVMAMCYVDEVPVKWDMHFNED